MGPGGMARRGAWVLRLVLGSALLGALPLVDPPRAEAGVVERVVAVVGRDAILLSELRRRARPALLEIQAKVPPGPQRGVVEGEMFKELLQLMVDEKLVQIAADRAQKRTSAEEIDNGMRNLAAAQDLTVEELEQAAKASGLSQAELRAQVARQVLEQKMLQLRVMPRVRISSGDVQKGYQELIRKERERLGFRLQWLVLVVPPGASAEAKAERRDLAERLSSQARGGADFARLVADYSDDSKTKTTGGDLGALKPGRLAAPLEKAAIALDIGAVSAPVFHGNAYIILRLTERDPSGLPPLDQAHDRIASEVFTDRLKKARRQWLDELKRSTYVDVRL